MLTMEFVKFAFILRCKPSILRERLSLTRDYSHSKIEENVQAEIMDECLIAMQEQLPNSLILELDTSDFIPEKIVEQIICSEISKMEFLRAFLLVSLGRINSAISSLERAALFSTIIHNHKTCLTLNYIKALILLFHGLHKRAIMQYNFTEELADHIYDIGRRNDILHQWSKEYTHKKGYSYLFQKRNQRGMYYLEDRDWEAENYQLSYQSLIKVLSQSKITLVSPPDRADSKRTGRVSPLTHRYLEAAMCQAVMVGFTPTGGEYVHHFPKDFTIVPKDYGEFEEICDRLIDDNNLRTEISHKNRNYVIENHSVEVRYKQL